MRGDKKTSNSNRKIQMHNILVVDDEPSVLTALKRTFQDIYNVTTASSGKEAIKIFKQEEISLIIADQKMPEMTGIELLEKIKNSHPNTVRIMLTAYTDIKDIIAAINRCDLFQYITKPWEDAQIRLIAAKAIESYENEQAIRQKNNELQELNNKLEDANKTLQDKVEERTIQLKRVNKELEKLAITDPLTGLSNRRYFEERLSKEFQRMHRYSHNLSLVMIDIDHFKKYNDLHGHLIGDAALKELSKILSTGVRTSDFISRYGGEEFVITLPETNKQGAYEITERIRKEVEKHNFPHSQKSKNGKITISTGIASSPDDAEDMQKLIEKADIALYCAKDGGRNKVVLS